MRGRPRTRPRWHEEREEPDYRFTLADERNFPAWSLALAAGAVALNQLVPPFRPIGASTLAVVQLVLIET
ncbi:hypothetical protein ACH347_36060 [Saccharopolyspora sp. 5N102]